MPENKTVETDADVQAYIDSVKDERKRADSRELIAMMSRVTGLPPKMWGPSMIGFGSWHYRYASGHEGDTFVVGFAPRASAITLYLNQGPETLAEPLARLGKHSLGKGCLYIKRLSDIDETALRELIKVSIDNAARFHVEP